MLGFTHLVRFAIRLATKPKRKPLPTRYLFVAPERPVWCVFLHCSASDRPAHDDVSVIRRWHVNGNGWRDVGYHFFIQSDGTVQEGRPLEQIPAAQKGHNAGSIAICLHGKTRFTDAQFEALRDLCHQINDAYQDAAYAVTFHGHCEVARKACPVFDYKAVLDLDEEGRLSNDNA